MMTVYCPTRLVVVFMLAAACGAVVAQQKPPVEKAKKDKLARLAEPWPDAEQLRQRRVEAEKLPLFASEDTLTFTLAADFKSVNKDRNPESTKRFPGTLTLGNGGAKQIPVKIGTRGHVRRLSRTCSFVPLRLEFEKADVTGTIFDSQDELKLVTHCQGDRDFDGYVTNEYLAYRIYRLMTPRSFRARLCKVTYVDSTNGKNITTRYAIFTEKDSDVAKRMEGRVAALQKRMLRQLDQESLTMMALLEYVIGNTDYSIIALHNVRLIQDQKGVLRPVGYDFDMGGLVNPPYATPHAILGIKTVRDRLYRGPCGGPEVMEPYLAQFRAKQDQIMKLVDSLPADADRKYREDTKEFLSDFFSTISRPGSVKREFLDRCPKVTGM